MCHRSVWKPQSKCPWFRSRTVHCNQHAISREYIHRMWFHMIKQPQIPYSQYSIINHYVCLQQLSMHRTKAPTRISKLAFFPSTFTPNDPRSNDEEWWCIYRTVAHGVLVQHRERLSSGDSNINPWGVHPTGFLWGVVARGNWVNLIWGEDYCVRSPNRKHHISVGKIMPHNGLKVWIFGSWQHVFNWFSAERGCLKTLVICRL